MQIYAIASAAALLLAYAGTRLFDLRLRGRTLADRLTNPSRAHDRPYTGGFVLFASICTLPFGAALISDEVRQSMQRLDGDVIGFYAGLALIFLFGVYDDLRVANFKTKLVVQTAAAIVVVVAGWRMDAIGLPWDDHVEIGFLGAAIAVVWIVAITNSVNLIDGKDGVAAGVSALAGATITVVAIKANLWFVGVQTAALTFAALGFLPYNFPPARRFLGDSGAMLLGFGLATLSLKAAATLDNRVYLSVPALALGFPIADTMLAIVRRGIDHRHPFKGDLDHIHHRLEERVGLGPRGILLLLYGLAALFSGGALLIRFVGGPLTQGVVFGLFSAVIALVLARLGYFGSMWDAHHSVRLRKAITRREVTTRANGRYRAAANGVRHGNGHGHPEPPGPEATEIAARRVLTTVPPDD